MENCSGEKKKKKIVRQPWDNSSLRFHKPTEAEKKAKEYFEKVEEINLRLLDLECEVDCLLKKKKHFLELIKCGRPY